jgi:16S rRNA (guanine966-N2)-methyltransferase
LRIIAGTNKGRSLSTARGRIVRPTTDKVREALFNILAQRPSGAKVLDLFSGTGALGLEALSRGARSVVFIEHHKKALEVLRKNIVHCNRQADTRIVAMDVLKALNALKAFPMEFDLVFMDPPYNSNMVRPTLNTLIKNRVLAAEALIVVEHTREEAAQVDGRGFHIVDQRRYGRTQLSFLEVIR